MKKIIFLVMVALFSISMQSMAATAPSIINKSLCSVTVRLVCYNPTSCTAVSAPCAPVTVLPNGTAPLPTCSCSPYLTAYEICWVPCPGICVIIGNVTGPYPCASAPQGPVALGTCLKCGAAKVFWDAGNLIIE
ncbi:MAG TPA: hypothetical protein VN721_07480 [Flavipsychrobacter sp.]|nr:hypothetical protein [Flavipsychrobacter sp.]